MKLIEKKLVSKSGSLEACEDGIFLNNYFAAVVDGATSKSLKTFEGKSTGKLASELITQSLQNLQPDISRQECFQIINSAVLDWYNENKFTETMLKSPADRLTASVIIYSATKRELWMVGDCQALVSDQLVTNSKLIDSITSNARAMFIESEIKNGKSLDEMRKHDTGRDFITPLLLRQSLFQNTNSISDLNYTVIDGFFKDHASIKIIPIPAESNEIVLASDGYPFLKNTLKESEAKLEVVLRDDPLMYRLYKSTKGLQVNNISFDDRAYLRLEL